MSFEVGKLKVGDRVKVVNADHSLYYGHEGTVIACSDMVLPFVYQVKFDDSHLEWQEAWFGISSLKKISGLQPISKAEVRLKVGDSVNVIGGDCKGCVGRIVDHYTTAGIKQTRETYAVEMIKDGRWTQVELDGSCIECAEPKKTKSNDIWHVNAAEFALRDYSGLAFGEDACDEAK